MSSPPALTVIGIGGGVFALMAGSVSSYRVPNPAILANASWDLEWLKELVALFPLRRGQMWNTCLAMP